MSFGSTPTYLASLRQSSGSQPAVLAINQYGEEKFGLNENAVGEQSSCLDRSLTYHFPMLRICVAFKFCFNAFSTCGRSPSLKSSAFSGRGAFWAEAVSESNNAATKMTA